MITQEEYDEAVAYEMVFTNSEGYVPSEDLASQQIETENSVWSYYVDYVIQSVRDDLMDQYGYSRSQASSLIYSGGLRHLFRCGSGCAGGDGKRLCQPNGLPALQ